MFTGIIRATAAIQSVEERQGNRIVAITRPRGWRCPLGGSIAVDGICSTVIRKTSNTFSVEYMPETLRITTAVEFSPDRIVNLEMPLRLGETLDGHFVQGHVDTTATVVQVARAKHSRMITVRIPRAFVKLVAPKGSITVNGVALTVARMKGAMCTVSLIPYTLAETNLGLLTKGTRVNIEIDLIARYLAKLRA